MSEGKSRISANSLILTGIVAGLIISAVDNLAYSGIANPFVVVAMLLAVTGVAGIVFTKRGLIVVFAAWVCNPLVHAVKHIFNSSGSLHPETWLYILMLAIYTLVISLFGWGLGLLIQKLMKKSMK